MTDYHTFQTFTIHLRSMHLTYAGKPGVPEWRAPDEGTVALIEAMEIQPGDRVLDLACGAGLAGAVASRLSGHGPVWLLDSLFPAVQAARHTLALNQLTNAQAVCSDGAAAVTGQTFDVVTAHLPRGKVVAEELLCQAHAVLRPGGRLYFVAHRLSGGKGYVELAREIFGAALVVKLKGGYRVVRALRSPTPASAITLRSPLDSFASPVSTTGEGSQFSPSPVASARTGREAVSVPEGVGGEGQPSQSNPHNGPIHAHPCRTLAESTAYREFSGHLAGQPVTWLARPGVFSWNEVDQGTQALVRYMEVQPGEHVLDLGCAAGLVGLAAARQVGPSGQVVLVDADVRAVESARRTLERNAVANGEVCLSDVASAVADRRFDVVLANPPFHQGRQTEYEVARQFVLDSATVLHPGGRLYLVANRFLDYEHPLRQVFGGFEKVFEDTKFKVLKAVK